MLFNSLIFLVFLPIVFFIYWFLLKNNVKHQNILLLFSSYIFYGWWDWMFLFLLMFSTGLDYYSGLKIHDAKSELSRKIWLVLSVSINLGFLGIFKYYNFFISSFQDLLQVFNLQINVKLLNVILPVGISFYTFHGLSYVIDIYKRRIVPERGFVEYGLFVSYFPLLVAGPIERATHLLPQIQKPRIFNGKFVISGINLVLWGYFKKVAIADNISPSVDEIFNNYSNYSPAVILLGAFLFSIQIYCDFSGYSDIARGVSRFFGLELLLNFNFPYFSKSIPEFWKKWHISLSSWFRDYLYIPLGGSRVSKLMGIRNVFIIFLVSGFWHGANWTFIIWGLFHALMFLPSFIVRSEKTGLKSSDSNPILQIGNILLTFVLVTIGWVIFRANNLTHAFEYFKAMVNIAERKIGFSSFLNPYDNQPLGIEFLNILALIVIEILIVKKAHNWLERVSPNWMLVLQGSIVAYIIINVPINKALSFIYFQF
jgi:alginate O-acetyltransferase complex protein AlgI